MAVFVVGLVFILAFAGYSDASYCICNSGLSDAVLQKDIDYACGNGADCAPIQQSGSCYNPNTVRDHCSYAVNSYYQKKGNIPMNCDFGGTASVVTTLPSTSSGCVYPSSSGSAGGTTPSTTPPTGGTPTPPTGGTPTGGTPTTFPPPGTPANGGGGSTTTPGTFPGSTVPGSPLTPGGFGLAPAGTGFGSTDNASTKLLSSQSRTFMIMAVIFVSSLFV